MFFYTCSPVLFCFWFFWKKIMIFLPSTSRFRHTVQAPICSPRMEFQGVWDEFLWRIDGFCVYSFRLNCYEMHWFLAINGLRNSFYPRRAWFPHSMPLTSLWVFSYKNGAQKKTQSLLPLQSFDLWSKRCFFRKEGDEATSICCWTAWWVGVGSCLKSLPLSLFIPKTSLWYHSHIWLGFYPI